MCVQIPHFSVVEILVKHCSLYDKNKYNVIKKNTEQAIYKQGQEVTFGTTEKQLQIYLVDRVRHKSAL